MKKYTKPLTVIIASAMSPSLLSSSEIPIIDDDEETIPPEEALGKATDFSWDVIDVEDSTDVEGLAKYVKFSSDYLQK